MHLSCWKIDFNAARQLCAEGHEDSATLFKKYSQFKFGNTQEVAFFSETLYRHLKSELESANSNFSKVFSEAAKQNAHIYFTAPGIRNVPSASNLLLNLTGMKLNRHLARKGIPTAIIRPITRLASGRANYAEMPKSKRDNRKKTTQSLIPESEYSAHPIHVVFFDDLIASGSTVERARKKSLDAGALSFTSCTLFQSTPDAAASPQFEHVLNSYDIDGGLDESVVVCLHTQNYVPVQRMLRLLLHPSNREQLIDFAKQFIPLEILIKICSYALANDYLTIVPQKDKTGLYGPSLMRLIEYVERKNPTALS